MIEYMHVCWETGDVDALLRVCLDCGIFSMSCYESCFIDLRTPLRYLDSRFCMNGSHPAQLKPAIPSSWKLDSCMYVKNSKE